MAEYLPQKNEPCLRQMREGEILFKNMKGISSDF